MASGNLYPKDFGIKTEIIDTAHSDDTTNVITKDDQLEYVRKPNSTDSSNRVQELLKCPVCLDDMYPPILQCSNGHPLCSICRPRLHNQCPTCRQYLGNIRCLTLEQVAETLEFPCKYQSFGCVGILPYLNKLNHENGCAFRPYNCPYVIGSNECTIVGGISSLVEHLKNDHKIGVCDDNIFNTPYKSPNPLQTKHTFWTPMVACCLGQYFCLHFEAFQLGMAPVYIAFLRFMGEENEANKYCYSVEVEGNERKLSWQGKPRSIRENHSKVRDSCDGLIIQRHIALFISGGNQMELNISITTRIWENSS